MVQNCKLVGLVGILIQVSLGALSFSVLIFKRWRQKPKRPWRIWILDTSKQIISQLFAHFINLTISIALSSQQQNSDACLWYFVTNLFDNTFGVLACVLMLKLIEKLLLKKNKKEYISGNYHRKQVEVTAKVEVDNPPPQRIRKASMLSNASNVNQQIANSILVQVELQPKAHSVADSSNQKAFKDFKGFQQEELQDDKSNREPMINKKESIKQQPILQQMKQIIEQQPQIIEQSHQGANEEQLITKIIIDYKAWIVQLLIWIAIVTVSKSIIFGIQFGLRYVLMTAANAMLGWIKAYPILQLLLVIVLVPVIMNGLAFWVQDNFLMKKTTQEEEQNLLQQSHQAAQNVISDIQNQGREDILEESIN